MAGLVKPSSVFTPSTGASRLPRKSKETRRENKWCQGGRGKVKDKEEKTMKKQKRDGLDENTEREK